MGNSASVYDASSIGDQSNKTFLITGANCGLGFASAEHLLRKNASVILACRDLKKAADAKAALEKLAMPGKIDVEELDLADLDQIKVAAERILKTYSKIDVLMLNAGFCCYFINFYSNFCTPKQASCFRNSKHSRSKTSKFSLASTILAISL